MSVRDCVDSMLHLIENANESVNLYNLGTGDTCSVRRIAEIVVEESGLENVSVEYTGGKRGWAGDVPKTFLNVDKLLSTDFKPTRMSEETIRDTVMQLIYEIGLK